MWKLKYVWFAIQARFRDALLKQLRAEYKMKQRNNKATGQPASVMCETRAQWYRKKAAVYRGYGMEREAIQMEALAHQWASGARREHFIETCLTANAP